MTSRMKARRLLAGVAAIALATTACGLKTDAYDQLEARAAGGSGNFDGGSGTDDPGTGDPGTGDPGTGDPGTGDPGTGDPGTGNGTGGPGTGNGTGNNGTGNNGNNGGPTSGPTNGPGDPGKGTRIGIDDKNKIIRIGVHAPLTGASPLPAASFESGRKLFWQNKTVFGYKVEMEILDDTYKPSGAVAACQKMARRDFIVVGGAGTDQIQACARDKALRRTNTPYLSAGVTTNGLTGIPNYYSLSMPYKDQMDLVVKTLKNQNAFANKWAVVISNTPNFADAKSAILAELDKNGVSGGNRKVIEVSKAGSNDEAGQVALELAVYNAPIVFFLGQPDFFIKVVSAANSQAYYPIWTGVGVSMGVGTVVNANCGATAGRYDGRFLHPTPGPLEAPPAFYSAGGKDDIELLLWGLSEMLYDALLLTKGNFTRENFLAQLGKSAIGGHPGGFPRANYAKQGHFAGEAMWSLKSSCGERGRDNKPGVYRTVGSSALS